MRGSEPLLAWLEDDLTERTPRLQLASKLTTTGMLFAHTQQIMPVPLSTQLDECKSELILDQQARYNLLLLDVA